MKTASFLSKPFSNIKKVVCMRWQTAENVWFELFLTFNFFLTLCLRYIFIEWTLKKCCLLFSNISFLSRDIQLFKYAIDDAIHSTKFWSNMMKKDISAISEMLILRSKILLNVLHNTSSTVLLPWQHTGFQTSSLLKVFLATFGICYF